MIRRIITIDEGKCDGCGLCASACHEGAIAIVDGKAKLTREDYCDGLGDCLPACPTGAISFEDREAAAYDEAAVQRARQAASSSACESDGVSEKAGAVEALPAKSQLGNWPVQVKLAPTKAPYFDGAHVLIAADCTAFAYGDFQNRFMRRRVVLVACPKLDMVDYAEKLAVLFRDNDIASITLTRMTVPCCGGLENAIRRALEASGKDIPLEVAVIGIDGALA